MGGSERLGGTNLDSTGFPQRAGCPDILADPTRPGWHGSCSCQRSMTLGKMTSRTLLTATVVFSLTNSVQAQTRESSHPVVAPESKASQTKASSKEHALVMGWVVSIDGPDVVVDLGATQGLHAGDVIEIWRPIKLKHPVTGKVVTDRFRTGDLTLNQVRGNLSWARPVGTLERPVAVGDFVQFKVASDRGDVSEPTNAGAPTPETARASSTPGAQPTESTQPRARNEVPSDADALQVAQLFEAMQGRSPVERAAYYEHFARSHRTRFARVLHEEAALLRAQAGTTEGAVEESGVVHEVTIPDVVRPDRPLVIGLWMPGKNAGAVLQVRAEGDPSYSPYPMRMTSPDYYEAEIPVLMMKPPAIAICIERVGPDGKAYPLTGTASQPVRISVRNEPDRRESAINHATVRLVTDYADWNRGRGNDYAWQTEGDIGFRLSDKGIRAVRSGFGVYRGKGGTLDELDKLGMAPRSVGLTYGYLEGEFGFSSFVSLVGRATVGLGEDGVTGGGQAFVRLGNDLNTNLMLGGEVLGGIGLRGIAQLELKQFERFPITLRSEVTNQPAGVSIHESNSLTGYSTIRDASDVGVRIIGQVGYRVLPTLTLALRGSYQGRTINHAGPGGGAAVIYTF